MGSQIQPFEPLAVVGMGVAWGGCDSLDAFERLVFEAGARQAVPTSVAGEGAPKPVKVLPAGDILLAKVARQALQDAELAPEDLDSMRVALLVAGGRPARQNWEWASRIEDLSDHPNPLVAALERSAALLPSGEADVVVFAAGSNLNSLPEDATFSPARPGMGFDRDVHGWRLGEGAGAVVWMKVDQAVQQGRRIYAVVRAAAAVGGQTRQEAEGIFPAVQLPVAPSLQDVSSCCQAALAAAGVSAGQVGYLDAFASGQDALDGIESAGLVQAYRQPQQALNTALGSGQASVGYLGPATGLVGFVQAALCLHQRTIPGLPGWAAPKLPALWRGAPFYVPGESRSWFEKKSGPGRLAGLNVMGLNGSFAHLILGELPGQPAQATQPRVRGGFHLFPLAGDTLAELVDRLSELRQALIFAADLNDLAAEYYETVLHSEQSTRALAIVGHHHEDLLREIDLALNALPAAFENGTEWQTPLGSYFTSRPVGRLGGVALVYPGAFNSYPGVGKDLFRLFPGLYRRWAGLTDDLGAVFREQLLYPRSLAAFSSADLAKLEASLLDDPIAMLISGTALAVTYTYILQQVFAIQPGAAFGYSLGENSMMYATGVWGQGDAAAARLAGAETFRVRLAGPQLAIREYWGLEPAQEAATGQRLWANYLVMAAPEKVQQALAQETRVYLTHINTPRQVVIGGDPDACQRVLAQLRCSSLQAPFDYALHCDVIWSEYEALADLHNWPIEQDPGLRMYTAADYAPLVLEQVGVSGKFAHMLTTPLDFPRLVQRVYADGARVFIEAGAGSNCARWIAETLKGSPHLALSMNRRGTDDYHTLVRMLARLYSHQVPMDLSALYLSAAEKARFR